MHETLARRLTEGHERIAVTGATGWFGRVTLDLLGDALGAAAFAARVRGYASEPRTVTVEGVGDARIRALEDLEPAEVLLHYAFLTRNKVADLGVEAFVTANLTITRRVLRALERGDVGALFVASSGAAREPDLDLNTYGALKRLDELTLPPACPGPSVVARVFNVSGPHMTKPELYVLGELIKAAKSGRPLRLRAPRRVMRSYAAVSDVVTLGLLELLEGRAARFETAGERCVEVGELAEEIRSAMDRPDLAIERPPLDEALAEDRYIGDGTSMRALAARHGLALQPLADQILATAAHIA